MDNHPRAHDWRWCLTWLFGTLTWFLSGSAQALEVQVEDGSGTAVTGPIRWLLAADNTVQKPPGVAVNDSISLVIHASHAPVAATGESAASPLSLTVPDSAQPYYLSVMAEGYSVGGTRVAAGQTQATVILNPHRIPTSQISIFVFEDLNSINNVPDATEPGLGGFRVVLLDPLGGGPISQDAFGNPLGTTYRFDSITGEPLWEDDSPVVETMGTGSLYTDSNGRAQAK